jgi:hypothetical protein
MKYAGLNGWAQYAGPQFAIKSWRPVSNQLGFNDAGIGV